MRLQIQKSEKEKMIIDYIEKAMATGTGRRLGVDKVTFIIKHRNDRKTDLAMICGTTPSTVKRVLDKSGAPYLRRTERYARLNDVVKRMWPDHTDKEIAEKCGCKEMAVRAAAYRLRLRKSERYMAKIQEMRLHNIAHTPERIEKIANKYKRSRAEDIERVRNGLPQKFKFKINLTPLGDKKMRYLNWYLTRRYGYIFDMDKPNIYYYTAKSKRSPYEYIYSRRYGFKFYEKR